EELFGEGGGGWVGVPELAGDQKIGGKRRPVREVGGVLEDKALGSIAGDTEGEFSPGEPERRIKPQLGEVDAHSPGYCFAEEVGGVVADEGGVVPDKSSDPIAAIRERLR